MPHGTAPASVAGGLAIFFVRNSVVHHLRTIKCGRLHPHLVDHLTEKAFPELKEKLSAGSNRK
jgi:hypothetical protein